MNKPWKTGGSAPERKLVQWPGPTQWAKQLGIILVIVLLWSGLLAGVVQLTAGPTPAEAQASAEESAASAPTATETLLPTDTPTPPPSPTATHTPPPPDEPAPPADAAPVEASPTATVTPSPEPTATSAPEPPSPTPPPADIAPPESDAISFANDVLPIFENRCVKCHGGEETKEGLVLTNHADALAGSWNGTVIEPGNPAESYLIEQIESGEMPKKEPRLLPAEIRTITEWIAAGAPDN